MTTVTFHTEGRRIVGFEVKGHSGYAQEGEDIVCAAMSALVYVQVRLLEEAGALASLEAEDGFVRLHLKDGARCEVLEVGARWLGAEYPRCVTVKES